MSQLTMLTRRLFATVTLVKLLGISVIGRGLSAFGEEKVGDTDEATSGTSKSTVIAKPSQAPSSDVDYLHLTEAEWKKRLTAAQFQVARKHGTERAYSGKYHNNKKDGAYLCVCCNEVVFDSQHKFDSGTGWPSFWQPVEKELIEEIADDLLGYPRTEVHCKRCNAHLGHVFQDAPKTPTGLRYCINSICLNFVTRKEIEKMQGTQK